MIELKNLSYEDVTFLSYIGTTGISRKLLNTDEIKTANRLYKLKFLEKGHSQDKYKSVFYYVDSAIYSKL